MITSPCEDTFHRTPFFHLQYANSSLCSHNLRTLSSPIFKNLYKWPIKNRINGGEIIKMSLCLFWLGSLLLCSLKGCLLQSLCQGELKFSLGNQRRAQSSVNLKKRSFSNVNKSKQDPGSSGPRKLCGPQDRLNTQAV